MKKALLTILLFCMTVLPAVAAPTNTSGPWGISASGFSNFSTAATSPSTLNKTIVIDKPVTINNKTISGRTVKVITGGSINVAPGCILNINGAFEAGKHLVFTGSGTVVFSQSPAESYPEWWGAITDNLSPGFDSGPAVRKALLSGAKTIKFGVGTYNIGMTTSSGTTFLASDTTTTKFGIITSSNVMLTGSSVFRSYVTSQDSTHTRSTLKFLGTDSASVGLYLNGINARIESLELLIDGVTPGAYAIKGYGRYNTIRNCAIRADKGINITYSMDTLIEHNKMYVATEGIQIEKGTTFLIHNNYVSGTPVGEPPYPVADSKGIVLGNPASVSPSGDSTYLSGTSSSNIIESFDFGHYLNPAHGVINGSFSPNAWASTQITLRGTYYENIKTNHLWTKDANLAVRDNINNSVASTGYPYNVTWNKVTLGYRYLQLQDKWEINTDRGLYIGPVSGPAPTDALKDAIVIKPWAEATPRLKLISTGGSGYRKSEIELRDASTNLGHIIRYNRDIQTPAPTASTVVYPITGATTEGSPVAWFTPTYTAIINQIVATASLPAASASMDGRIIIEDAGSGDQNLIIYSGGQRFRIDGAAPF